jgi:hypothetical protein
MRKLITTLYLSFAVLLGGCWESSEVSYERGYDDGYAVGYNTACKIRSTLIDGDWSNKHYSRGYSDGNTAGIAACQRR